MRDLVFECLAGGPKMIRVPSSLAASTPCSPLWVEQWLEGKGSVRGKIPYGGDAATKWSVFYHRCAVVITQDSDKGVSWI